MEKSITELQKQIKRLENEQNEQYQMFKKFVEEERDSVRELETLLRTCESSMIENVMKIKEAIKMEIINDLQCRH